MKSGTFLTLDRTAALVAMAGDILEESADEAEEDDMDAMAEEAVSLIPCNALKPDQKALVFFFLGSGCVCSAEVGDRVDRQGMLDHAL
jgi:hypothetical protein